MLLAGCLHVSVNSTTTQRTHHKPTPHLFPRPQNQKVPEGDYTIPLGKAEIMRRGTDVTVVGWGGQLRVLEKVTGDVCVVRVCVTGMVS